MIFCFSGTGAFVFSSPLQKNIQRIVPIISSNLIFFLKNWGNIFSPSHIRVFLKKVPEKKITFFLALCSQNQKDTIEIILLKCILYTGTSLKSHMYSCKMLNTLQRLHYSSKPQQQWRLVKAGTHYLCWHIIGQNHFGN